jgi:hypothetical protein
VSLDRSFFFPDTVPESEYCVLDPDVEELLVLSDDLETLEGIDASFLSENSDLLLQCFHGLILSLQ